MDFAVSSDVSEFNLECVESLKFMSKEPTSLDSKCTAKRWDIQHSKQRNEDH